MLGARAFWVNSNSQEALLFDENPVDYRDRHEVEACLTFTITCTCVLGFALNLLMILTHM